MALRIAWRTSLFLVASILAVVAPPLRAEAPQFEESLESFEPRRAVTEEEQDRSEALSLYGMARDAEGRGDSSKALRFYQRTLRYDPSCLPAARAILRLALQLQRRDEAVDAALGVFQWQEEDRLPLQHMALHLVRQGRWEEAVDLYERSLAIRPSEPKNEDDVLMMMEMARLCHLLEYTEKAADYFRHVFKALEEPGKCNLSAKTHKELLGKDAATYQLIGRCFLAAGRVEEAEAAFKKSEETAPNTARAALNAASIHCQAGRFEEALDSLEACFHNRAEEKGFEAYLLLEKTFEGLGRGRELVGYLEGLREEEPENASLGYFLAEKLFDAEEYDRAERLYASLVEGSATSTAYQKLLEIYIKRPDYVKAGEVLSAVAGQTGTLDALGDALGLVTGAPEAMEAIVARGEKSLAAEDEADTSVVLAAALVALAGERFEAAEPLMRAAVEASPGRAENLLLIWGLDCLSADRSAEAARIFREGLDRDSVGDGQRAVLYYYLAAALELDGQTEAALEAARAAVKLNEDAAPFHIRVAWVLYHRDRKREAAEAYRAVIERFDEQYDSDQARQALRQARMVLSTLCVNEHRVDEAVEWLEQVLDEFPEDAGALNDLGYLWADENQHIGRAYRMVKQAVAAEPDNAAYRDSLGWVLYRQGRYQEAVAELEKASELEPDPVVLDHLGDAYMKAGQPEKSVATWERSVAKFIEDGQDDEAAKVREKLTKDK